MKSTDSEQTNLTDILESVNELSQRAGITVHRAFTAWYAINMHDLDEDDALGSAAMDGGNDQGIDLVFADDSTRTIYVVQGHCGENHEKITSKAKWSDVLAAIPFFEETDSLRDVGRHELADQIDAVKTENAGYAVAFGLLSLGKKNSAINKVVDAARKSKTFNKYQYFYLAQAEIREQYNALLESERGITEDQLAFSGDIIDDSGDYGRAWIGNVSATELIRLHRTYSNQLFAGNVRLFLGSRKGGINEQIIKTATETPGLFWALNNGVSIIADTAIPNKQNKNTLTLRRFSIVNGCQTTNALTQANASEDCKVLVRVIAAKEAVKNDVVRFNNSQNAIKIWTVRAVDGTQERLRRELSAIGLDYAPKQSGSRRRRDKTKIIELDRLAQFLAAQKSEYLIQAIDNKAELFDQPYSHIFYPQISANDILLAWQLGNICEEKRAAMLRSLGKSSATAGLLAVTATFWIIFTASRIISKMSDIHSPHITLERINTDAFRNALAKIADAAIEIYFMLAVDTYQGGEFGTHKSTLRATKFLQLIEPKIDFKVNRLEEAKSNRPPVLENVAKSIKA
ncbi:AIPR family protein [Burkholderia ambifaria]|uniref:AIPR family protein n=1 Tax=Burkholderia ambifaria TaxID=152480 RepID=UPI001E5C7A56|nr:AIPR family protein [Burkholderia ambifaria]UEP52081.1 AIPR family protein [Burkholderia ambifaria]